MTGQYRIGVDRRGARAAYQVGVMRAISDLSRKCVIRSG